MRTHTHTHSRIRSVQYTRIKWTYKCLFHTLLFTWLPRCERRKKVQVHASPSRKYAYISVSILSLILFFLFLSCVFLRIANITYYNISAAMFIKFVGFVFLLFGFLFPKICVSSFVIRCGVAMFFFSHFFLCMRVCMCV